MSDNAAIDVDISEPAATAKPKGPPRVSFKDVQLAYFRQGIAGVAALRAPGKATDATIAHAAADLGDPALCLWAAENGIAASKTSTGTGRGRTAPAPGQERSYSVLTLKGQAPFIRLPVSALPSGTKRVNAVFTDGEIVIRPVDAT